MPPWRGIVLGTLLSCLSATLASGGAKGGWYPAAGAGWVRPMDSGVRDIYGGGPSFFGAMGYAWPQRMRAEVRMDLYRQTGHPPNLLATVSKSKLTLTPVSLELHLGTGHGSVRPYVLAGPGLVFSEEQFTYGMFRATTTASGRRTNAAAVFGGGVEVWGRRVIVRSLARAMISGGHKSVLRATGRTDDRANKTSSSLVTLGLELQLR
jgi:hypothetical protein